MAYIRTIFIATDGQEFDALERVERYERENHIQVRDEDIFCWNGNGEYILYRDIVLNYDLMGDVVRVKFNTPSSVRAFANYCDWQDYISDGLEEYIPGTYNWDNDFEKWIRED